MSTSLYDLIDSLKDSTAVKPSPYEDLYSSKDSTAIKPSPYEDLYYNGPLDNSKYVPTKGIAPYTDHRDMVTRFEDTILNKDPISPIPTSYAELKEWKGKYLVCIDNTYLENFFTKGRTYECVEVLECYDDGTPIPLCGHNLRMAKTDNKRTTMTVPMKHFTLDPVAKLPVADIDSTYESTCLYEAICIDNKYIEDQFDIGVSYLAHKTDAPKDMILVENALGLIVTVIKSRFKF